MMLGTLEADLRAVLLARQAAADGAALVGADILAGPPPAVPTRKCLGIHAHGLVRDPPTGEEARPARSAWRSWPLDLTVDPAKPGGADLPKPGTPGAPPAEATLVEEVQAPPGTVVSHGDDYVYDAESGRLGFADAAISGPVTLLLREKAALPGLRDLAPATLRLSLVAEAPTAADADAMLGLALDACLGALARRDVVTLAMFPPGGLRLRLLGAVPALEALERGAVPVGTDRWARATATLRLQGDLETQLTLPVPPAQKGTIREVDITLARRAREAP